MARSNDDTRPGSNSGGSGERAVPVPEDDVTSELPEDLLEQAGDIGDIDGLAEISIASTDAAEQLDLPPDEALPDGFVLNDRYEILSLVHSGGMGHVYRAIDHNSGGEERRIVAIKMLRDSVAAQAGAGDLLAGEAERVQALSHPNVIDIFDFDQHDGHFFLVMEWLDGESVNAYLRRTAGRVPEHEFAWTVIRGVAAALRHAHDYNIVHADINPSNIFITDDQQIKLLDFGVARENGGADTAATGGLAWVTQTYASPEVLSGKAPVFEDDIFSLACVAYRLLGGRHPFGGTPSLLAQNKGYSLQPIEGLATNEWQLLRAALAYRRADRPRSPAVFIRDHRPDAAQADGKESTRALWPRRLALPGAIAAALVAGYYLTRSELAEEPPRAIETRMPAETAVDEARQAEAALVATLLGRAQDARAAGALIDGETEDARSLYRQVLDIEAGNAAAQQGLRTISDIYVQRADSALRAGDPVEATASLAIAAETAADNPAIEIVNTLLIAQGDRLLVDARLAAVEGDAERAASLLAAVEQFSHVDRAAIEDIRRQLAEDARDALFLQRLDTANAHITAGRLTRPENQNALEWLLALYAERPLDPRLLEAMERLGQRLLTRAALSTAAGRYAEAAGILDAADELGVLAAEVETAREALQVATAGEADDAAVVAEDREPATAPEDPVVGDAPPADPGSAADTLIPGAETGTQAAAAFTQEAASAGPETVADADTATPAATRSISELGIERYVAPEFPRVAQRRNVTGYVDIAFDINADGSTGAIEVVQSEPGSVFNDSATEAVGQWKFAPREGTVRAIVRLRFAIAP